MLSVSRETVRKALAALAGEGWIKNVSGQGRLVSRPRRRPVRTTGLFFPFDAEFLLISRFNREVYTGLSAVAVEQRRHVLNFYGLCRGYRDLAPSVFWSPGMRAVDSLMTLEVFRTELIGQAARLYPVVCLDAACKLPNVSSIAFDHAVSTRMAFKYLLDLGHRRIGYVGKLSGTDPAIGGRLAGYHEAFRSSGLPAESSWIWEMASPPSDEDVERFIRSWQAEPPSRRPTGLIVLDAFWPVAATFFSAGVKIPADISLLGIGTSETWAEYLQYVWERRALAPPPKWAGEAQPPRANRRPELALLEPTRIDLPARRMGRWGMEELIGRLKDPAREPRHEILIPKLIAGGTTVRP